MGKSAKIICKIISQKGTCVAGHYEGQEFDLSKDVTVGISKGPNVMCPMAYYALFPFWKMIQYGGDFVWEKDPDKTCVVCPDALNPLIMEIRRVKE